MASFPVYQSQGNLALPDPRSMVVDWGGIADRAISTFIEARKLGMQEDYNNHLIQSGQQRMELERKRFGLEMEKHTLDQKKTELQMTEIQNNMTIDKMNAERQKAVSDAQVKQAEVATNTEAFKLKQAEEQAAVIPEWSGWQAKNAELWNALTAPPGASPIEYERQYQTARDGIGKNSADLSRMQNVNPKLGIQDSTYGTLGKMSEYMNVPRYKSASGRTEDKEVWTFTDPKSGDVVKALADDIDITKLPPSAQRTVTKVPVMYSHNQLMTRAKAGDTDALATLAQVEPDTNKVEDFLKKYTPDAVGEATDTDASIRLGNARLAAKDPRWIGTVADRPEQKVYDMLNVIEEYKASGTLDDVALVDPPPMRDDSGAILKNKRTGQIMYENNGNKVPMKNRAGKTMTNRDVLVDQINVDRGNINPSGTSLLEKAIASYDERSAEQAAESKSKKDAEDNARREYLRGRKQQAAEQAASARARESEQAAAAKSKKDAEDNARREAIRQARAQAQVAQAQPAVETQSAPIAEPKPVRTSPVSAATRPPVVESEEQESVLESINNFMATDPGRRLTKKTKSVIETLIEREREMQRQKNARLRQQR